MPEIAAIDELKSQEQIAREKVANETLEAAATRLEKQAGNRVYKAAWRAAAKLLRTMKY
jgi:hypothetical protein